MVAYPREESVGTPVVLGSPANPTLPGWVSASVLPGALLRAAGGIMRWIRPAMLVSADAEINRSADAESKRSADAEIRDQWCGACLRRLSGRSGHHASRHAGPRRPEQSDRAHRMHRTYQRRNGLDGTMERWNDVGRLCPGFSFSPSCSFWARPGSAMSLATG
jgi:hypothetical protein